MTRTLNMSILSWILILTKGCVGWERRGRDDVGSWAEIEFPLLSIIWYWNYLKISNCDPKCPICDNISVSTYVCITLHRLKRVYRHKWDRSGQNLMSKKNTTTKRFPIRPLKEDRTRKLMSYLIKVKNVGQLPAVLISTTDIDTCWVGSVHLHEYSWLPRPTMWKTCCWGLSNQMPFNRKTVKSVFNICNN